MWLTGRVHEEECDESFSVFCFITKNCVRFLVEKRMERREMIKREIATLEKALEKGDLESFEKCLVVFNKEENLGSLSHYSTVYSSIEILSAST